MEHKKYTREECIALLQRKQTELKESGLTRFPQRSDFTDYEVMSIKAFLGAWPHALEAAGLKEPRGEDRLEKNRKRRARAKKRMRRAKRAEKADADAQNQKECTGADDS